MAPRGIIHESPAAGGRNSEMISPPLPHSPKMPRLNCCGRDRERALLSLSLSITTFSPSHARSTFDTRMGRSTRARFTSRKCGQRPVFFAFCCPFIDLDAIFVSRLRNMGRLHHAQKNGLRMAIPRLQLGEIFSRYLKVNSFFLLARSARFSFHLLENDSMHTTLTNRVMQSDLSASPPTPFLFFVSAFPPPWVGVKVMLRPKKGRGRREREEWACAIFAREICFCPVM